MDKIKTVGRAGCGHSGVSVMKDVIRKHNLLCVLCDFFSVFSFEKSVPMCYVMDKMNGEVVKQGFMVKRSQNKKRFTPVNYKERWFVLTRQFLIYYDGENFEVFHNELLFIYC